MTTQPEAVNAATEKAGPEHNDEMIGVMIAIVSLSETVVKLAEHTKKQAEEISRLIYIVETLQEHVSTLSSRAADTAIAEDTVPEASVTCPTLKDMRSRQCSLPELQAAVVSLIKKYNEYVKDHKHKRVASDLRFGDIDS